MDFRYHRPSPRGKIYAAQALILPDAIRFPASVFPPACHALFFIPSGQSYRAAAHFGTMEAENRCRDNFPISHIPHRIRAKHLPLDERFCRFFRPSHRFLFSFPLPVCMDSGNVCDAFFCNQGAYPPLQAGMLRPAPSKQSSPPALQAMPGGDEHPQGYPCLQFRLLPFTYLRGLIPPQNLFARSHALRLRHEIHPLYAAARTAALSA